MLLLLMTMTILTTILVMTLLMLWGMLGLIHASSIRFGAHYLIFLLTGVKSLGITALIHKWLSFVGYAFRVLQGDHRLVYYFGQYYGPNLSTPCV